MKKIIPLLLLAILLFQCGRNNSNPSSNNKTVGLIADNAMVVSARAEASQIGVSILKKGGNAFDAMIATELALAVAYPFAGNIGGGGFMVYRTNEGKTGALDYREKAPLAASKNMYLDENEDLIAGKSTLGPLAIGIPGTIAGLFKVHEKFGTIPFSELIQPAIDLANKGVIVTARQAERLNKYRKYFSEVNDSQIILDAEWKEGDTIKYPNLAKTFERIKAKGKDGFYKGKTAEMLVNYVQNLGGIITKEDLDKYEAQWRNPIEFTYKDLKITTMSPPSSGGICNAQIFKALEPFDIASFGHNSVKYLSVMPAIKSRTISALEEVSR